MSTAEQLSVALPRRRRVTAAAVTVRPLQWVKNALVIAAPAAAGALAHDDVPVRITLAALAFCLLSGGIYALNDVRDAAEDRQHPRKRFRPVAAGELPVRDAVLLGSGCLLAGLLICAVLSPLLAAVGAGYLALTLSYTWLWRRILLLDIVAIAGGFVLRALAGGVAAPVGLSRWFVLVVSFAALFVAAGKRYAELRRTGGRERRTTSGRGRGRSVMRHYTPTRLRLLLAVSGAGAVCAYWVWAFDLPAVHGIPWRLLTAIPFTAGILRYGALVRAGAGEAPEEIVLSDRVLALIALAWLALFALTVHATV
jgi:decaprenyl-phosphate phosphoribosyltransferase